MEHKNQLANVKYRNWVKGGLSLKYLKEGCEKFIDETVSDQHSKYVADIKRQYPNARGKCVVCFLPQLKPLHAKDEHGQCSLGQKAVCNCLKKGKSLCPDTICSAMYDKFIFQHRYRSPNWNNTNIRHWFSNHWELAKCYISAGGYTTSTTAADTDCLGLLSIAINDQEIHTRLDLIIDPPNDPFSKECIREVSEQTRRARDDIFHSSTLELDDTVVQEYIDDMIRILEDKKELCNRIDAQEAVKKLKQLKNDSFTITSVDEMEIRREAMEAIREMKAEALKAIEQKKNECISEISSSKMKTKVLSLGQTLEAAEKEAVATKSRMKMIEARQNDIDASVKTIHTENEQRMKNLSIRLDQICEELAKVKNNYTAQEDMHSKRIAYLQRKKELQTLLIAQYQKYYSSIPFLPLIPERDTNICHMFVRPDVTAVINTDYEDIKESSDADGDIGAEDNEYTVELVDAEDEVDAERNVGADDNVDAKIKAEDNEATGDDTDSEVSVDAKATTDSDENEDVGDSINTDDCLEARNNGEDAKDGEIISISSYKDIFKGKRSPHRNIYLIGEAGSGKTTLCKHIIADWCNIQSRKNVQYAFDDEYTLLKFEFMFFVSLRHSAKKTHIHKMIIDQLLFEGKFVSTFKKIIQNESTSCLIILDGLDEWRGEGSCESPSTNPHVPHRNNINQYTILTTSRAWKFETIHLKKSECDLLIQLNGLNDVAQVQLIENSVHYLNNKLGKVKSPEELKQVLFSDNLYSFCKTPLFLGYLVSLWFDDKPLGPSRCDIYFSIINLLLNIAENKENETNCENLLLQYSHPSADDQHISLPIVIQKYTSCVKYRRLLLIIAKFALDRLVTDSDESLVFAEPAMQNCGLAPQDITVCQQVGIITISKVNPKATSSRSQIFSFPHKTFQEFLTALYLSVGSPANETIRAFHKTIMNLENIDINIVEMVTAFLCGMNPEVGKHLFQLLEHAMVLHEPDQFDKYCGFGWDDIYIRPIIDSSLYLQNLSSLCISESSLCGYKDVKLNKMLCSEYELDNIEHFDTRFFKVFDISRKLSTQEMEYLAANEFPSLEYLFAACHYSDFKMASVLLSKASRSLKYIDIGSRINPEQASMADFSKIHQIFLKLLPNLHNLQSLCLCHASFDHLDTRWFLRLISKSNNFKEIVLIHIHCFEHDDQCEGTLDFSNHLLLRHLELFLLPVRSVMVNTSLVYCKIYTLPEFTNDFKNMSIEFVPNRAKYLQTLVLNYPSSFRQQFEVRHLLQMIRASFNLQNLSLTNVYFGEQILNLSPESTNMNNIKLQSASMTKNAFCKFIDSVPVGTNCVIQIANLIITPLEDYDAAVEYAGDRIRFVQNIGKNEYWKRNACCFLS